MAEQFYTILTKIGKAKIANTSALGSKLNLAKFQVGDSNGSYYNPTEEQTELKHKVWEGPISSITIDENNPNWIVLQTMLPGDIGGFMIREAGVFDDEGNLIAVGKYPETYKPVTSEGSSKDLVIKMILEVSNASSVTLKIDPTVILATKKDIEILENKIKNIKVPVTKVNEKIGDVVLTAEDIKCKNGQTVETSLDDNASKIDTVLNSHANQVINGACELNSLSGWNDRSNGQIKPSYSQFVFQGMATDNLIIDSNIFEISPNVPMTASFYYEALKTTGGKNGKIPLTGQLVFYDKDKKQIITNDVDCNSNSVGYASKTQSIFPNGTKYMQIQMVVWNGTKGDIVFSKIKVEYGSIRTVYSSEATLNYLFQSVSSMKVKVASATTDMGVPTDATATVDTMAGNIRKIFTGKKFAKGLFNKPYQINGLDFKPNLIAFYAKNFKPGYISDYALYISSELAYLVNRDSINVYFDSSPFLGKITVLDDGFKVVDARTDSECGWVAIG